MPPKSAGAAAGDAIVGGLKMGWRGLKAGKATADEAIDAAKEKRAVAAANELEREHKERFQAAQEARGRKPGAQSALYAKHAQQVKDTNNFGLSEQQAAKVKTEQATAGVTGGSKFGFFAAKPTKAEVTEKDQLLEIAKSIGWDEDMLEDTIDGLDGDLAQVRVLLEAQAKR